jgi:hypothetical protein
MLRRSKKNATYLATSFGFEFGVNDAVRHEIVAPQTLFSQGEIGRDSGRGIWLARTGELAKERTDSS